MVNKWIEKIIPENFYDTKVREGGVLWRFSNVVPFVSSLPFRVASRFAFRVPESYALQLLLINTCPISVVLRSVFPQIRH